MTKGTSAYVIGIHISNGPASGSSATGVVVSQASGMNANITVIGNTVKMYMPVYMSEEQQHIMIVMLLSDNQVLAT